MIYPSLVRFCSATVGMLCVACGPARGASELLFPDQPGPPLASEAVLFGFDSTAFPFQLGLETRLIAGKPSDVIVPPGPPGSYDEFLRYYGTVLRIDGEFRMWYYGTSGPEPGTIGYGHGLHPGKALCYATSKDGVHWEKPNLGLVEYQGSKANNIVQFPEKAGRPAAAILYEPDDPNPERRFKMAYEADRAISLPQFCVAFSADGLRWTLSSFNPVGPFLEMSGVAKFHGRYYVSGQDWSFSHQAFASRHLVTFVSTDFEHWSPCAAVGLNRSSDLIGPSIEGQSNHDEEVHLGAALWNRGNVLLGIYGQWHGSPEGDRRQLTMDLGFTVSHDGLHHQEPVPGYKMIASHEQPGTPPFDKPALMQGQGMENVGDSTYYWYSLWKGNLATGVRLATWERDRLGMLKPYYPAPKHTASPFTGAQAITCAFRVSPGGRARVFLNASGLGPNAKLSCSVLDASFQPVKGYVATVTESGYRMPLTWQPQADLGPDLGEVHIQVRFEGVRAEEAKLHALYIDPRSN